MITLITNHPIAYESPDHLYPWGTKQDNSTNSNFVEEINNYFNQGPFNFLDLGCSGGQLVIDMKNLHPNNIAVGLEGSDYSVKHKRANWPKYHNQNLFTCDITEPFHVKKDNNNIKFDLITAWEVLEHIAPEQLDGLFQNIYNNLSENGIFAGSINMGSDKPDGVELHLTRERPPFWEEVFNRNNLEMVGNGKYDPVNEQYAHHYQFKYRVRGRDNGCSFWTTLRKKQ